MTVPTPAQAGVQDGYQVPQFVVPYAQHAPKLDGVIHDDEWANALSFSALQTSNHAVSSRQTRFWMMWDAGNIYIAMRSPLRPGERLQQAHRIRTADQEQAVYDDAYEIFLDAGTQSPDGEPVYFQYLGNYAGARYDVMYEPAVGNRRPGWTAKWPVSNHLTSDGRVWEMELAIPRKSIYRTTPFTDGFAFTALMARDYKRPWEQNSVSGAGSFAVRDTYARFTLSRMAPGVQLLSVGDPQAQTFGLSLAADAPDAQTLRWTFDSDGGVHQQGTLAVQPNASSILPPMLGLDKPGSGAYRIRVTSADFKTTYLDWSAQRQWGDFSALTQKLADTGDQVTFSLQFNPIRNVIRATGDLIEYDNRAQIARSVITVRDAAGKSLAQKNVRLDALAYVHDVVPLPDLAPGNYKANLTAFDPAGKILFTRDTNFEKNNPAKSYAWWNTPMGNADRVLKPWTPVRYRAGEFSVWGRTMQIGAAGLPAQIEAQDRPLLARPGTLVGSLNGKSVSASSNPPTLLSKADNRVVVLSRSTLGNIDVRSITTVEYDGMYRVEMTLIPHGSARLDTLKAVISLRSSVASYLHACGEGIRYGFTNQFLSTAKQGKLWDSKEVDGQPMTVGSFIPYVWLGDPSSGLCWFADSDQGWTPDDKVPAIAITRGAASTDLVLNLIGHSTLLNAPRTITFAFEATPTRPLQPNWRMSTWWTGDSFKDWAQVESQGHAGDEGLIFSSLPFPLDPVKSKQMVDARHAETNGGIFGIDKYRANAVPYFEHINMGEQFVPELTYFSDEWRTNVTRGLAYGKTLQDFMVYHVGNWAKESGIDGFYIDNVAPIADSNVEAGRGYRLPDGRIQPAYQMFDTRRYFLRMRAALAEQGKSGYFVMHITNHMIAPWIESADVALDGEDHVIYPEMHKDFMDFWSLERLRLDYPEEWGTPVNFLQEYQGNWDSDKLKVAMRAYTGLLLLQDTLVSANPNGNNQPVWQARDRFGMQAADVRFLPSWSTDSGLKSNSPAVHLAGWLRPVKGGAHMLMLAVVNTGEACTASVTLSARQLGLPDPSHWLVSDAETLQPIGNVQSAELSVAVPRHDYRLLLIQPRP